MLVVRRFVELVLTLYFTTLKVLALFVGLAANAFKRMRSLMSSERVDDELRAERSESPLPGWVGEASCVGDDMEEVLSDEDDEAEQEDGVSRAVVVSLLVVKSDWEMGDVDEDDSLIMLEMERSAHQCSKSKGTKPFRCGYSVAAASTCRCGPFWVPSSLVYFSQTIETKRNQQPR